MKKSRVNDILSSFFLIFLILNLTTSCFYYKVNTKTYPTPEDIRWESFNDKYMILHEGDSAWHMENMTVDTNQLTCQLSSLPPDHLFYQRTNPNKTNRYYKSKHEQVVLDEVHLYTSAPLERENDTASIGLSSFDKMEIYYLDKSRTVASHVVPAVLIPIVVIVMTISIVIALTKSSCPYVYILDDDGYKFIGEIYSGAIYSSLERDDYLPLEGFQPYNDRYTLKIANKLPEKQYLNFTELWIADHPGDIEVLADKKGNIHTFRELQKPVVAVTGGNQDLSGLVENEDDQAALFNEEPGITGDPHALNSIELTFQAPPGRDMGKLVLNARNSYWGDYIMGEFTKYFGDKYRDWVRKQSKVPPEKPIKWKLDQNLPLMVYLETDEGWEFVDYFDMAGPLAFRNMVMPVDLTHRATDPNGNNNLVKIKIETGFMFWELDYAAMDFSADELVDKKVVGLSSAENESGKDVLKRLTDDDNKYYSQPETGNEVILEFNCPQQQEGLTRSVFLHAKGYYEHIRYYEGDPDREMLLTFRQPGRLSTFSFEKFEEAKSKLSKNTSTKTTP